MQHTLIVRKARADSSQIRVSTEQFPRQCPNARTSMAGRIQEKVRGRPRPRVLSLS